MSVQIICSFGMDCKFKGTTCRADIHADVCTFALQGKCTRGDKCKKAHPEVLADGKFKLADGTICGVFAPKKVVKTETGSSAHTERKAPYAGSYAGKKPFAPRIGLDEQLLDTAILAAVRKNSEPLKSSKKLAMRLLATAEAQVIKLKEQLAQINAVAAAFPGFDAEVAAMPDIASDTASEADDLTASFGSRCAIKQE